MSQLETREQKVSRYFQIAIGECRRQEKIVEKIRKIKQSVEKRYRLAGKRVWEARKKVQDEKKNHKKVWTEFEAKRKRNDDRIKMAQEKADLEHRKMLESRKKAKSEYDRGNYARASFYHGEAIKHEQLRNELNAEVIKISGESRRAKEEAQELGSFSMDDLFDAEKSFEDIKADYEAITKKLEQEEITLRYREDIVNWFRIEYHKTN